MNGARALEAEPGLHHSLTAKASGAFHDLGCTGEMEIGQPAFGNP